LLRARAFSLVRMRFFWDLMFATSVCLWSMSDLGLWRRQHRRPGGRATVNDISGVAGQTILASEVRLPAPR
jgi:hypothetical protein